MRTVDLFKAQLEHWELSLPVSVLERMYSYAALLDGYEEANIVGSRGYEAVLLDHVLDSLSCLLCEPVSKAGSAADVGSGGGLPALPIKLARPELNVTMVESVAKKTRFLDLAIKDLDLGRIEILAGRAEEVGQDPDHRKHYDVVTARAVASLPVLAEYGLPLVRVGGHMISMKGNLAASELSEGERAAEELGAVLADKIQVPLLPQIRAKNRTLVVLEKVRATPLQYPRKPGTPAKRPLGKF